MTCGVLVTPPSSRNRQSWLLYWPNRYCLAMRLTSVVATFTFIFNVYTAVYVYVHLAGLLPAYLSVMCAALQCCVWISLWMHQCFWVCLFIGESSLQCYVWITSGLWMHALQGLFVHQCCVWSTSVFTIAQYGIGTVCIIHTELAKFGGL